MCGIAGCFGRTDVETVNRMLDAMTHRGPDDRGTHTFRDTVFGHTRLSIVDVARGHQPILAGDGQSGIICNGEIYNFEELRRDLTPRYEFSTRSDTEVILRSGRGAIRAGHARSRRGGSAGDAAELRGRALADLQVA